MQLSDAAGSFASPTSIGSATSTTGGSISVTIPAVAAGTGYLMRVVSSNPVLTGTNSGAFSIGTVLNAPTFTGAPFCAGTTFNVTNNLGAGCSFNAGNTFTVQLSNAAGSFAAPTTVGSVANTTIGGTISVTIPNATAAGAGYLFRVVSTNPIASSASSSAFTITAIGLNAPTVAGSPFCVGSTFNITNNLSSACGFDPTNTFTVQLSDGAGSFASPTTIGTAANTSAGGTIPVTIPLAQASGNAYRIRVVASNPSITSANNGANLTISPLLIAPTGIPATLCQGATFNVTNNLSTGTGCSFNPGNNFNVQLSNAAGSFASPTVIGTATNTTTGGSISVTIPFPTATGTGYRIRVVGTNPSVVGPDNGSNLTVSDFGINAPTFAGTTFCPNQTFNVNYTLLNSCTFPNTPSNNVFTAQLSNSAGSFGTPTDIGSVTASAAGAISVTIPVGITPGNGYRIRVISTNPSGGRTSPDNGTNLTINAIGLNAPTGIGATYCANATFNITNVPSSACNFVTGNTFTAQLSDASGSFASPTNISSAISATAGGTISVTLPSTATTSSNYLIQVVSTNPVRTSISSGPFTINALAITAPTITGGTTTFCQGQNLTIAYTVNCTFPAGNVFTAQLSDAAGSFASPVSIGTITATGSGNVSANIGSPVAGTGYRIRIISSNPSGVLSPNNANALTVNASAGTPSVFGNGVWNAYVYSGQTLSSNPNTINSNIYLGRYIENNLNFNTQSRWANTAGPVAADASQGAGNAYQGCPHPGPVGQQYSVSLKRTNIPCGYYQIDIPGHDDDIRLFIDGIQVYVRVGCCASLTNIWTGFISPTTTVEFQFQNGGGPGYLQANFVAAPSPLTISPSVVQCSTPSTPATLTVSSPLSLTYA
ncbi:MAG: beta strand repeat-containing protein, partial [Flammeovirgaceae bacterium]